MSPYILSGLKCHFWQLPYMDRRIMEPLALSVTSFKDEPYIVFSDILVALCVASFNHEPYMVLSDPKWWMVQGQRYP